MISLIQKQRKELTNMKTSMILGLIGAGFTTASSTVSLIKKEREKIKNRDKLPEPKAEKVFYKSKKYMW